VKDHNCNIMDETFKSPGAMLLLREPFQIAASSRAQRS